MNVLSTWSPKCSRTSSATPAASRVRASYIVIRIAEIARSGLRCWRTMSTVDEQLPEAFQGVVLGLDRDHHLLAGDQRVEREQAQGGRAVDEDVVVAVLARLLGGADLRRRRPAPSAAAARGRPRSPARSPLRPGRSWRARRTGSSRSGQDATTSASGTPSTSRSYVDGTPRWCSTLIAVEALPWGSRSTTRTRCPNWASAAATLTVDVVLPTPPFWLATTTTRVRGRSGQARAAHARALPGEQHVLRGLGQRGGLVAEATPRRCGRGRRRRRPCARCDGVGPLRCFT